jgi:hypothetical protein
MIRSDETRLHRGDTRRFPPPPDPESRGPEAVAALGAPEIDRLGRQVTCKINLPKSFPQAPISSDLGSHHREAVRTHSHVDDVGGGP